MLKQPSIEAFSIPALWRRSFSDELPYGPFLSQMIACCRPINCAMLMLGDGFLYDTMCSILKSQAIEARCSTFYNPGSGFISRDLGAGFSETFSEYHGRKFSSFSTITETSISESHSYFKDVSVDFLCVKGTDIGSCEEIQAEQWFLKLANDAVLVIIDSGKLLKELHEHSFFCQCEANLVRFDINLFGMVSVYTRTLDRMERLKRLGGPLNERSILQSHISGIFRGMEEKYWNDILESSTLMDRHDLFNQKHSEQSEPKFSGFQSGMMWDGTVGQRFDYCYGRHANAIEHSCSAMKYVEALEDTLSEKDRLIEDLNSSMARTLRSLDEIYASTSWKISKPVRVFGAIIKVWFKFLRVFPKVISGSNGLFNAARRSVQVLGKEGWVGLTSRLNTIHGTDAQVVNKIEYPTLIENAEEVLKIIDNLTRASESRLEISNESPQVSIVIPCFGKVIYTLNCISSLLGLKSRYSFQIIVVDDGSEDDTEKWISALDCVTYHRNSLNQGFVSACNQGAALATGMYLVFLNNDTMVMDGWLDELVDTFSNFPEAGLVGSKMVHPNGKLQEAGCIVWSDGSAWNYGRGDDPSKPQYNYARQVDYCSGASIIVPRDLFLELGKFDPVYSPAYCEDSDLAFKIRSAGRQVWYQPLSSLAHFEGVTCGTDIRCGVKKYQVANQRKFLKRWKDQLSLFNPPGVNVERSLDRTKPARALFIDHKIPEPDKDAGSLFTFNLMKVFLDLGFGVSFLPENFRDNYTYRANLERNGLECLVYPHVSHFNQWWKSNSNRFDLVVIFRCWVAKKFIELIRSARPEIPVIVDTADLHFLRESRQSVIENSEALFLSAMNTKAMELSVIEKVNCAIVHSDVEKKLLEDEIPKSNIEVFNWIYSTESDPGGFDSRSGIFFLGGFDHPPNVDAVKHFVREIFPLIKMKIPQIKFYVLGSSPPAEICDLATDNIVVTGYIADLSPILSKMRVGVCPLRFGAGIKGKIAVTMSHGIPCVTTPVSTEGFDVISGEHLIVAENDTSFANSVASLYKDRRLWQKISSNARNWAEENLSFEAGRQKVIRILDNIGMQAPFERLAN